MTDREIEVAVETRTDASSLEDEGVSLSRPRLRLSINKGFVNKTAQTPRSYVEGWENVELTVEELIAHIRQGWAYCAQLKGERKRVNFKASDIVSVDIDGAMAVEQALSHPLVADHAAFIYTTASHSDEEHRFRIVFVLPRTILSAPEMASVASGLSLRLKGDMSATDASRLFFGSEGAQIHYVGKCIDKKLLSELIAQGQAAEVGRKTTARSGLSVSTDYVVRLADGARLALGSINGKEACYCPFHADDNASAFVVHSQKGVPGIHCSTCCQTYWPEDVTDFDFDDFEKAARKKNASDATIDGPLSGVQVTIVNDAPTPSALSAGFTFVKSAKGTGKTEGLRSLTAGKTVLVVGHRRLLNRQMARRLGLTSYLDRHLDLRDAETGSTLDPFIWPERVMTDDHDPRSYWKGDKDPRLKRFGVSVDSLHLIPPDMTYDVIAIDESEQVLGHFLADTLEDSVRDRNFMLLSHLVKNAKSVIALDADLGWTTFNTLSRMGADLSGNVLSPRQVWINETLPGGGRSIEIYDSEKALAGDLLKALDEGKRCLVASSSKKRVDRLESAIRGKHPELRILLITAETQGESQKKFIDNPAEEFPKYDVVLASPSLGTGVDITFPGGGQGVDVVFGFCDSLPITHFDFDQQLSRVRNPKETKIWISPRRASFETNLEVVRNDLLHKGLYKNTLSHWDENGQPVYVLDPLIEMAALVTSQQRASMNRIKANFISHKEAQGFTIVHVGKDGKPVEEGKALLALGKELDEERYVERLMGASAIMEATYRRLLERIQNEKSVTEEQRYSVNRTSLELFYRQRVSVELVRLDRRGAFRDKVRLFERVISALQPRDQVGEPAGSSLRDRFIRDQRRAARMMASLLRSTPLVLDGEFQPDREIESKDLEGFVAICVRMKSQIENLLGENIRQDFHQKPVQQLSRLLSLMGLRLEKVSSKKVKGVRTRKYRLAVSDFKLMKEITARRGGKEAWPALDEIYDRHLWNRDDETDRPDWWRTRHLGD